MFPKRDGTFVRSYPSHASFAGDARRDLQAYAAGCGMHSADIEDVALALGEVLVFAVQRGPGGGGFAVSARFRDDTMEVVIRNDTAAVRDADAIPLTPRGYSMQIIRKVIDRVTFSDGGTRVRLVKRLRR